MVDIKWKIENPYFVTNLHDFNNAFNAAFAQSLETGVKLFYTNLTATNTAIRLFESPKSLKSVISRIRLASTEDDNKCQDLFNGGHVNGITSYQY